MKSREEPRELAGGTPRWVKWFSLGALLFLVFFAVLHFTIGGFRAHGQPPRHGAHTP